MLRSDQPVTHPFSRGPSAANSILIGSVCFVSAGQYFLENADALEGRFVAEFYVAGFYCYFGDASSSSLLIRLNFGLARPPAASPPFFTYLGLVALVAVAAFMFRLLERL